METTSTLPRSGATTLLAHVVPFVRTARGLAVLSLGVLTAHVLDDAFFQPSAGTGPSDHLVSGLVPAAILGGAAWAYGRVRPGLQAVMAIMLGIFGLVLGIEGVYGAHQGRLAGDDFTGLLAIPAGFTLLGIAAVTLWRSRRLDGHVRRYARRAGIAVAAVAVLIGVVYPLAFSHGLTHIGRDAVADVHLADGARPVTFQSADGLELSGLYLPSTNGAAVISFPGPGALDHARMLARHGYGVLMFDQRGEGDSQGDPNALGWKAEEDVRGAITFLQSQPDVDPQRIGGLGLSVGGETLLQTAAHDDRLHAVVSDGAGIRSLREQRLAGGALGHVIWGGLTVGTAVFSNSTPPANLKDVTAQIESTPLFIIHAEHGDGGEQLSAEYAAAAKAPTTVWEVPGTTHTQGLTTHPAEYEQRVIGFLDDALLGR
jgi:uncharacterized protein